MNIDELFHKYSMQVRTWDGVKIQIMYKEHFTEAMAEVVSFPVEAQVILQTAEEMEREFKNKFIQFYKNGEFDWNDNPIEVLLWIKQKFYNASGLSK